MTRTSGVYPGAASLLSSPRTISIHLPSVSPESHLWLSQHAEFPPAAMLSWTRHGTCCTLVCLVLKVWPSGYLIFFRGWADPGPLSTEEVPLLIRLVLPACLFRRSWPNTLQGIALRSYYPNPEYISPVTVSLNGDKAETRHNLHAAMPPSLVSVNSC